MTTVAGTQAEIDPELIAKNPNNPRRYFNEERLDQLRTSLQEVGVLVPLIVYRQATDDRYVLMDGERRWRCSLDLGLPAVPVNVIATPSPLENLLRMFNIHNVREDWPLISVALSLREVMLLSEQDGEKRLAELTGLTRSTVRRAKRLLNIPDAELELIQQEAHLDRAQQVHREDLYLEIEAAESVMRSELPELGVLHTRDEVIRSFAAKAETSNLRAVTDFRYVSKLVKAVGEDLVDRQTVVEAAQRLIEDVTASPREIYDAVAAEGYRRQGLQKKAEGLAEELGIYAAQSPLPPELRDRLLALKRVLDRVLGEGS